MRIDTFFDLRSSWEACTVLGKIFFFWLLVIGFVGLVISSVFLTGLISIGEKVGFLQFYEDEDES
jgi:hypothetical protein